ncbi:MAG TPA: hypothetical protein PKC24_06060 [Cyclobacteriaceae bacterium]|nr:hypothetical protein [Cyclobacteriaceae bacterium]
MIQVDNKYKAVLLEALEDMMYKLSLQLNDMKGGPLTKERKELSARQAQIEQLQHIISAVADD